MFKKIDKYIQDKINKTLSDKLPPKQEEEANGFFFLPETDRNGLLACSLQKTQNDITPWNAEGVVMDGLTDSGGKLNSAYAIYGQINDIIYTHFALQGFIGFQACALLTQNWLINKCCVLPPKDAMAPDYEISYKSKDINDEDKDILSELKNLSDSKNGFKIKELAQEFAEKKRQFGVAYAYPLVDRVNYEKPFDLKYIKDNAYKGMVNIDPYWVSPELDSDAAANTASQSFYEPTWYRLPDGKRIHKSWMIKSVNGNIPDILKPSYYYGGYPIPQLVYQRVYAAETVANEAPMLAKSKRLLYMDGNLSNYVLNQSKAENDAKAFSYFRDNWGVVVKRPDQTIGQIDTSLTDFDAVMMSQYQLVAAASGVHATKLLETQPKGFNTSGDFETAQYNALLDSIEQEDFKPYLNFHYMLLLKSLYDKENLIECDFNPIDTPTTKEVAECNEIKSRTNLTYVSAGVISADECRENLRLDPESGFNSLTGDAPDKNKEKQQSMPQACDEKSSPQAELQAEHEQDESTKEINTVEQSENLPKNENARNAYDKDALEDVENEEDVWLEAEENKADDSLLEDNKEQFEDWDDNEPNESENDYNYTDDASLTNENKKSEDPDEEK